MKRIFLFTLLTLIALVPAMADRRSKLRHVSMGTSASVSIKINTPEITGNCEHQQFTFSASITGNGENHHWKVDGQPVAGAIDAVLTKLSPGTHTISVEVHDPVTKCVAYDSANFEAAAPCPDPIVIPPPTRTCFTSGSVMLEKNLETPSQGDVVTIRANNTLSGGDYGHTEGAWLVNGGEVVSSNSSELKLDLTKASPGQSVSISYSLKTELAGCETKSELSFTLPLPPPSPTPRDLTPCTSFKLNQTRVDNACKAILEGVTRQLQEDVASRIILTGTFRKGEKASVGLERANNIKSVLTVTGIFATLDGNRVQVQPAQSGDGAVKITYLPPGAK
ncbi:MAG: hypothetical protein JST84_04635 [Acidobacteria bacterium]|nr:hypothetical protein [Acidobacteriota bacterium]